MTDSHARTQTHPCTQTPSGAATEIYYYCLTVFYEHLDLSPLSCISLSLCLSVCQRLLKPKQNNKKQIQLDKSLINFFQKLKQKNQKHMVFYHMVKCTKHTVKIFHIPQYFDFSLSP